MDVTVYKVAGNVKTYIYILIDNFSRFILNFRVSLELSGSACLAMVKESYGKYIEHRLNPDETTILVCDGVPENNNAEVDGFLNQEFIPIRKLIAQKDIRFSNSMIEAFNKTLKYRHLFPNRVMTKSKETLSSLPNKTKLRRFSCKLLYFTAFSNKSSNFNSRLLTDFHFVSSLLIILQHLKG